MRTLSVLLQTSSRACRTAFPPAPPGCGLLRDVLDRDRVGVEPAFTIERRGAARIRVDAALGAIGVLVGDSDAPPRAVRQRRRDGERQEDEKGGAGRTSASRRGLRAAQDALPPRVAEPALRSVVLIVSPASL